MTHRKPNQTWPSKGLTSLLLHVSAPGYRSWGIAVETGGFKAAAGLTLSWLGSSTRGRGRGRVVTTGTTKHKCLLRPLGRYSGQVKNRNCNKTDTNSVPAVHMLSGGYACFRKTTGYVTKVNTVCFRWRKTSRWAREESKFSRIPKERTIITRWPRSQVLINHMATLGQLYLYKDRTARPGVHKNIETCAHTRICHRSLRLGFKTGPLTPLHPRWRRTRYWRLGIPIT